ncbi:hypothetical protein BD410DRAFT_640343 [Rickenella mellea]|uniref:F-box domain-containing protein n=1 Tax=Rickenella mellea TaxID=50990 RepID=A0A4Y7PLL2_9AGAM|nr:hypothetical protein BD410DRAFT_640343 [Rickenella mellea]
MPTLPPEIWRDIIQLATFLPVHFETSPDPNDWPTTRVPTGYKSSIITKKFLSLVSHQFHHIISEFLYEIIHLEKLIQAQRLANGLDELARTEGCYPGKWTRHMFVTVSIVDNGSAATHVTRILRHCDHLVGFSWSWQGSWQVGNWDTEQIKMMEAIPDGVQYLDCKSVIVRNSATKPFFARISPSLLAMRISDPKVDETGLLEAQFLHLTHLDLSHLPPHCLMSMQNWGLNSLTCLSVSYIPIGSQFYQVLEAVGNSLVSLRLGTVMIPSEDFFSTILSLTKILEKFSYQFERRLTRAWSTVEHHSSLCHITCDIRNTVNSYETVMGDHWRSIEDHFMDLDTQRFPELTNVVICGVRHLQTHWITTDNISRRLRAVVASLDKRRIEVTVVN